MCLQLSFIPIHFISAYQGTKGDKQLLNILASHWVKILCGHFKKHLWLFSVNLEIGCFYLKLAMCPALHISRKAV